MTRGAPRRPPSTSGVRGPGSGGRPDRNAEMEWRLASIAARSTWATVCRIIRGCRRLSRNGPRTSDLGPRRRRRSSRDALCEILEARVLLDEGELHRPDGTVALLADDDLGHAFGFRVRRPVVGPVLLLAEDEHD